MKQAQKAPRLKGYNIARKDLPKSFPQKKKKLNKYKTVERFRVIKRRKVFYC